MKGCAAKNPWIATLLVLNLTGLCSAAAAGSTAPLVPARYQVAESAYAVPDVTLIDSTRQSVRLRELLKGDPPVMLSFLFASCTTVCPLLAATFAKVQQTLAASRDPLLLVSVSIDPEQDTPERLARYADQFKAGPNWRFLTGDLSDIQQLQRAFDAERGGKANHPSLFLIRARPDGVWLRLEGSVPAAALIDEYRKARAHE